MLNIQKISYAFLLTLLSSTVMAQSPTFYGKANISLQSTDDGAGSFSELKSNASRVGVKGSTQLDNDIEVLYLFEWQVDLADLSGSDNIKSRNQYVGLKTQLGTLLLGRNDTVLKQAQGSLDLFSDYEADIKGLWKGENRMSDSLTYYSPQFSGLSLGVTYIAKDELEGEDAQSVSLTYGDAKLKKDNWFAAIAADFDLKGYDNQRIAVHGKFEQLKVGLIAQRQEQVASSISKNGVMISASYVVGKLIYKAQFQTLEDDNSTTIGADYKLGKATKAYVWYTNRALENSEDKTWLAAGLEHKF